MIREFEKFLSEIRKEIEDNKELFKIESRVKEHIIVPVLAKLFWKEHKVRVVQREKSTKNRGRLDLALCDNNGDSKVVIEVKKLGSGDTEKAKKQAWDYAVAENIPLVVVTDGKIWSFYLLAEEGSYEDRCFCKLDLSESSLQESCRILSEYLARSNVITGKAVNAAEGVLLEKKIRKEARRTIPDAWTRILQRKKDHPVLRQLIEELANEVKDDVGYPPDDDDVVDFLQSLENKNEGKNTRQPRPESERGQTLAPSSVLPGRKAVTTKAAKNYPGILVRGSGDKKLQPGRTRHTLIQAWFTGENAERELDYENAVHIGIKAGYDRRTVVWQLNRMEKNKLIRFEEQAQGNVREKESEESQCPRAGEIVIFGKKFPFELKSGADAMAIVLQELQKRKSDLYERIYEDDWNWGQKKTRRRIAPSPEELYPYEHNRHLRKKYKEINNNWVVSTNYKREAIEKIIERVTTEAGFKFKEDVILNFDD